MVESVTFSNGYKMPLIGLGTFQAKEPKELETALDAALEAGYRHIDTAFLYSNEEVIGNVLKKWFASGKVKREDLFIVTKLPQIGMTPEKAPYFLNKSLKSLQLDYVDLYLLHSPLGLQYINDETAFPMKDGKILLDMSTDLEAIWKRLEQEVDAGKVRSLGVSNFNGKQVERIVKLARHKPMNNQVEVHAYFQQNELRAICEKLGVTICAYAPVGSPGRKQLYESRGMKFESNGLLDDPVVANIAKKHSKTSAQVLLRFLTQLGIIIIPKSTNSSRIVQNFQIMDFKLTQQDMNELYALDQGEKGRSFAFELPGIKEHPEFPF